MPLLIFIMLFIALDLVVLFAVGAEIGLLATLALIFGTGFLGVHLIRREGVSAFQRAQQRLAQGEMPSNELLTGATLIFSGMLLLAPGFISDFIGLLCLLPSSRQLLAKLLAKLPFRVGGGSADDGTRFHYRGSDDGWSRSRRQPGDSTEKSGNDEQDNAKRPLEGEFISKDERRR